MSQPFCVLTTATLDGPFRYRDKDLSHAVSWIPGVLAQVEGQAVDLIVLPAGYFAIETYSEEALEALSKRILGLGITTPICTVVDATHKGISQQHLYPFYGVVLKEGKLLRHSVQQTSTSRKEGDRIRQNQVQEECRVVELRGISAGLLCCGEVFCQAVRTSLERLKPQVIINMTHKVFDRSGHPSRWWPHHLRKFSQRTSDWILFSGPTKDPQARDYCFFRGVPAPWTKRIPMPAGAGVVRAFSIPITGTQC